MRPLKNLCEVAVIGGGMAGLSAARHAARLGRLVTLFEGSGLYGGLVATVGEIRGLPFSGKHSGQDLAMHLLEDCQKAQIRIFESSITAIETGERLTLRDDTGTMHNPDAVIIASGARLKPLGVPGEQEFLGRGVSRCATCDGGFFRKDTVVVTGGGDAAVHEALELSRMAREVIMVCRSPVRAKRTDVDRLAAAVNVRFVWDGEVCEILGSDTGVTGVRVKNVKSGALSELNCAGVFPFVGVEASTSFFSGATGPISTTPDFATSDARIFAVGAARLGYDGNLVQAMAEGMGAAESAARLLGSVV